MVATGLGRSCSRLGSLCARPSLPIAPVARLLVAILLLMATPAIAVDNARAAQALTAQAAKAYEAGDFVKAADLYKKAWQLDPNPVFMWALARAEHLSGNYAAAIGHYRQFLQAPGAESARTAKAQGYLADAENEVVSARAQEADKAAQAGDAGLAIELYLDCWSHAPNRLELLYKLAIAEQSANRLPQALEHLTLYLQKANSDAADWPQARIRRELLRKRLNVQPPSGPSRPSGLQRK